MSRSRPDSLREAGMSGTDQGEARRDKFETLMKQYVEFYLEHMRVEEAEILPLAESVLSAD